MLTDSRLSSTGDTKGNPCQPLNPSLGREEHTRNWASFLTSTSFLTDLFEAIHSPGSLNYDDLRMKRKKKQYHNSLIFQ